jgi:plastocyanin
MKRSILLGLMLFSLATVMLAACTSSQAQSGPNPVHMSETLYSPSKITIKKGEVVTVINDVSVVHVMQNGTWASNGSAKPAIESGAPKVELQVTGSSTGTLGPFNNAGTFQVYCVVHPNMNLTIVVTE